MRFVLLLLQVCLLGLGFSWGSPGKRFLMMYPQNNDPAPDVSHELSLTATGVWAYATVEILKSGFVKHVFLSAGRPKTIHLPPSVGMTSTRSPNLLSVKSMQPISVVASFCTQTGCDHSLLSDVSSWGTHYYPITPNFSSQTVSQVVVTTADQETSVNLVPSGDVFFEGTLYPKGSVIKFHMGAQESVQLQSNASLSGSEIRSQEAVCVVVGFTCSTFTNKNCSYGFAELKPVSRWAFEYIVPPLVNMGKSSSFLLAMTTTNSDLDVTIGTGREKVQVVGRVMKVIPVVSLAEIHITSESPLQLVYFRHGGNQRYSSLVVLHSVEDVCRTLPSSDLADNDKQLDDDAYSGNFWSPHNWFPSQFNSAKLPEQRKSILFNPDTDAGLYLSTINKEVYPAMCEKAATSCEALHCGHKGRCIMRNGKPLCSLKTKFCAAWGDSYYRAFDGRDFVLQGNCNYTLVQTTCPGSNASFPVQIKIARSFSNSVPLFATYVVQVNVQGFNISLVKDEKHQVRVDGQRRNLPLSLSNGTLNLYPSGSGVTLHTSFGLALHYDWHHHLLVEVGPELYGSLCGLCGNANHNSSDDFTAPVGTEASAVDSVLHWGVDRDSGPCTEDCGNGTSCSVSTTSQNTSLSYGVMKTGCALLVKSDGPFAECHSYIEPEPYVHSCKLNTCVTSGSSSAVCRAMTAYATTCQRLGIKVALWRRLAKCFMMCPLNSHYEPCGTSCPATCSNPEAPYGCTLPCVETCQCNKGYLLSGGKCVPHSMCGCTHQGFYYLPEESFWEGQECQTRCVCQPASRSLKCDQSHCQNEEVCKVLNGLLGCHKDETGVCTVMGLSHYTTFDGHSFDLQGNCSFLFATHCPSWGNLEDFRVEVNNQMKDDGCVSCSRAVKMLVHNYSIETSPDSRDMVVVNGHLLSLPMVLSQGKVKIYMTGFAVRVETDFGVIVTYNSDLLTVHVTRNFSGALCGLCGNFNSDPDDDLAAEESDISLAARRWQTSCGHGCIDVVPKNISQCNPQEKALYGGKAYCGRLLDTGGAFQNCLKAVDPHNFFESCVHDLCYSNGSTSTLCQFLSNYVHVCQEMGDIVDEWRASNFCSLSCPSNSEYHLCFKPVAGCAEPPSSLAMTCREGCFCKPGFFHSGGKCVPNAECGCIYNGVHHQINDSFHPDEHCQVHCSCAGHDQVHCSNYTCAAGTKCTIKDGHRACHPSPTSVNCTLMGGKHFKTYDGQSFDFHMGNCSYVLSQICDMKRSGLIVVIQQGRLVLEVNGTKLVLGAEQWDKVEVEGVSWRLPVQLERIRIVRFGMVSRVVLDTGVLITYGGPNLIQIVIPSSYGKMCGLCGNFSANDATNLNGSLATGKPIPASSWARSQSGTNCSGGCGAFCSVCNSTMAAEFASRNFCGILSAPAGPFGACHATVEPQPFFENCVTDLCASSGDVSLLCSSLRSYTFTCQEAGARVHPWRGDKCSISCPANSHYNVCGSACPESCGISPDGPCPWPCAEGCLCDSGYAQRGNGCVKAEQCGCTYLGHFFELGEMFWVEGCARQCKCSAPATVQCKPASCPDGTSCSFNDSWVCARKGAEEHQPCETGQTCGQRGQPRQSQCWVLGGSRFYTFDGESFEFQGNCTYTLVQTFSNGSATEQLWVGVQNNRTHKQASIKAIHVKTVQDHIAIYRLERGYAWINGLKRLLPVTLQLGRVKIHQSGVFTVVDTDLGIQVKYDCSNYATILLSNAEVRGLCGNDNGVKEDDLATPEGTAVDASTFGWSWRVPDEEGPCTATCGTPCPSCSDDLLQKNKVVSYLITLHDYLRSQETPFHLCSGMVNQTLIYSAVKVSDPCTNHSIQEVLCQALEAYAAACQNAQVHIGKWRKSTFCRMSCPANSHYEFCGSACPATCEDPSNLIPCTLQCVETCQCDPGFVLEGNDCVPLSQCGCIHNGFRYRSNQTFWADEGCTKRCICDPITHQPQCQLASCAPDEYCGLHDGVRVCVPHPWHTCIYSGRHLTTFDQQVYDFQGTCQYQLLAMCSQRQGLVPVEVHIRSDGHLESEIHVFLDINGTQVKIDSKNTQTIEVDGVNKHMPFLLSPSALAFSVGLQTYIRTASGFFFSLGLQGRVGITLSDKYANATCGLCGNFNFDPADDRRVNGSHLTPEEFGKAWRSGHNPWCMEGCLGGSCPTCSPGQLALYSGPGACGRILEANGPFRDCHGKVEPDRFYKHCVSDLCLHGGLQPALCDSLAEYTAVCLFHNAGVHAWRSPGFCYQPCPPSTNYSMSSVSVHHCLGWLNDTIELSSKPAENCICEEGLVRSGTNCTLPENCGCFSHGEYLGAGQKVSTCDQICVCHAGGHVTCRKGICGQDEVCTLIRGVRSCRPKPKEAHCSIDGGSHFTTFDGQTFEFHSSCNYTLAQTCSLEHAAGEPFTIAVQGSHDGGKQIYLQVSELWFNISDKYPGKVQVNGVLENLPFSQDNITVISKNGLLTIKALKSVQLSTDLHNQILVKIPNIYQQTTCGLCGNYNGNSSDDLQLLNGTLVSNPDVFGSSWRLPDMDLSCNDTCDDTCKPCISPLLNYTSELHCGLLTQPKGPFSLCHRALCPKQYYSFCMAHVCTTERQSQALCDALQAYEVACKEAGVHVGLWRNKTGCEYQCPQFSHYSQCANACSSLCPEVGQMVQCPNGCVEGCQCDAGHLYNGYACVPMGNCGCLQDGRRFEASESRLLQNCTVKCTCGPPLVCEKYSCPEQQNCTVSDGIMGCQKNAADSSDPCRGRCEQSEECVLSNAVPICETPQAVCWAWGDRHYHTFDGLDYDFGSTCTYLLAASRGAACGLMPFSVSQKTGCYGKGTSSRVVTVQAYGFLLKLDNKKGRVLVNGLVEYLPLSLLRGKIQVTHRSGRTLMKTDFGLQVVFDWGNTIAVTVNPQYKGKVYGLCGNFNGKPLDEHTVGTLGTHSPENVVDLAQEYRLFDGDDECCTNCHQTPDNLTLASDFVSDMTSSYKRLCAVLKDQEGPFAHCDRKVDADSFYRSCVTDFILNREPKAALDQAMKSYSMVCELINDGDHSDVTGDVRCPPNSHYKTCGSACPPSCDSNITICNKMCVQGCFCNPGFIKSPEGCVHPKRCGCTDSSNKYHSLNTTFWTPDNCGQLCVCGPAAKEVNCKPSLCPRGQVCKQLGHKSLCQPKEEHLNCSIVTGLHFITFDGHQFKFRDGCSYILVQTPNQTEMTPFNIIISDARCQKRFFHSLNLKLSVYNVEVLVSGDDPEKILVDGLHKPLPYYHKMGHINAYRTPSSLAIHTNFGLQLVLYKMGTITIILPGTYGSSVSGLCGNANANPNDELLMSNGERAQNTLEFAHSWRTRESKTCRSNCTSWMKCCSAEEQRLFEGSDFCGVLLNELGPFEECASVLSPINYFHSCVEDSCCYGGYYLAFCNAIASYAAACQAAQLPVRQWRSDTFCGMSCPKNSHYELCGPQCPVVCAGLSSPANCSGGCQEGCQCDNGYVRSDGQCVLVSDCGCMHNGQYYPAGYFSPGHGCQKCYCRSGEVSCKPTSCGSQERCSVKDGLAQCRPVEYGVCQVLAGFGYITFDGLALPHHGACTYVLSDSSSKAMPNYTLLLSFTKARNGTVHQISRLVFRWRSLQLSVDPETPWKIQLNEEELGLPFDMGEIKGYDDGSSLTIATVFGVRIQLSSSQYIRLSVPQDDDAMVSGLCGNFNGVKSDDFELKNNHLAKSTSELIQSWVSVAPGQHCYANCGSACDQCRMSTEACDILMLRNVMFRHCWNSGVEAHVYRDACIRAMCTGAEEMEAVCLAMEAYTAACKAKGITVGPWRQNTLCSLQCPDRSSPSECVDSSSNSCPALLTPGSSTAGCSEGCQCLNGNVFEGNECVPHSQCGCIVHEKYIKVDEQLYTENCSQRCWCHPLGGALCEKTICSPGQQCSLRNGSWGCHEQGGICELRSGLQATTLSGQQLNLKPRLSYNLVSFCDEASEHWFSLISYHGPCGRSFSRDVTVVQLLQLDSSVSIHGGKVKVNGHPVPLPYTLPSGGSLTLGANQDKSEITVVLSRDTGMESQLEIEVGDTIVTVKLSGWYKGKLCGICGDHKAHSSDESAQFWVLADLPSCGFNG